MKKTLASILASIALLLPSASNLVQACTGARQAGMGYAGVAACTDANAIYWNQAELPNIQSPEITYTKQFGEVENARYDDVISLAYPLTEKLGLGLQLMQGSKGNLKRDSYKEDESWIKFGAGWKLNDNTNSWNYSIGGALTEKNIDLTTIENNQKIQRKKSGLEYEASFLAERKNVFVKEDNLRFGVLAREQFGIDGDETGRNLAIRPATAYSFNDGLGTLTFASEFYEADELISLDKKLGQKGAGKQYAKSRFGIEQLMGNQENNVAIRVGEDGTANNGKGSFGAGIGLKLKDTQFNISYYPESKVGWAEIKYNF